MTHLDLSSVGFAWSEGVPVLDGITLQVKRGEFCVVIGASGCGKSTLLRLVAGLEKPSSGSVRVHRRSVERPENTVVFQDHGVFPWMRVRDNVGYALRMRGVPHEAAVTHWLARTGLSAVADAWPHTLSGGMRQRVAVARALANEPELLLMDEPFAAVDEQTRAALQAELLGVWAETGSTVLFVTHSLTEAAVLADRIVVLARGRVREVVEVGLPRPRDPYELQRDPAFGALVYRLYTLLHDGAPRPGAGS